MPSIVMPAFALALGSRWIMLRSPLHRRFDTFHDRRVDTPWEGAAHSHETPTKEGWRTARARESLAMGGVGEPEDYLDAGG